TYYYLEATNTIANCTSASIQTGAIIILSTPTVTHNFGTNDTSYCTNSNIKPLTITYNGIGISGLNTLIKWYYVNTYNGTRGSKGTEILDAINNINYIPNVDSGGYSRYYYATVKQTGIIGCATDSFTTATSRLITMYQEPGITTFRSVGDSVCLNGSFKRGLSIITNPINQLPAALTYQWYKSKNGLNSGGTLITGATNFNYSPPTNVEDTSYYYVLVQNGSPNLTNLVGCNVMSNISGAFFINPLPPAPIVSSPQGIVLGLTDSIKYLEATPIIGDTIKWYSTSSGGAELSNNTKITTNGTVYYATQVGSNGCETPSPRTASVVIKFTTPPLSPKLPIKIITGNGKVTIVGSINSQITSDSATSYVIFNNLENVRDSFYTATEIANFFNTNIGRTINNLTNKQKYLFRIKAINAAGTATTEILDTIIPNYDSIINYKSTSFKASTYANNGDYVTLPTTLILDSNYTIETWFNLANVTVRDFSRIFNFGNDYLLLGFHGNSQTLGIYVNGMPVINAWPISNNPSAIIDKEIWNHFALVVSNNGKTVTLYLNGVAIFTGLTSGTNINNSFTNTNFIGKTTGNQSTTTGEFEDFRIWKKAKTALEVYQQYNAKLTGTESGLYYWLPLGNNQHERFNSYNIANNTTINNFATSAQSLGNVTSIISSQFNGTGASWYYNNIEKRVFLTHRSYNNGEITEISLNGGIDWYSAINLPISIGKLVTINLNDEILTIKQAFRNGVIKSRIRDRNLGITIANISDFVIQTVPDKVIIQNIKATNSAATINFRKPIDTGLSTIIRYQVINNGNTTISANGQNDIAPGSPIPNLNILGNSTQATITGLTNGTMYRFAMKAINEKGIGDSSDGVNIMPLDTAGSLNITICDTVGVINFNSLAGINYTIEDTNLTTRVSNIQMGTTSVNNTIYRTGLVSGNDYRFYITLSSKDSNTFVVNTPITKTVNKIIISGLVNVLTYCTASTPLPISGLNVSGGNNGGLYTYNWYKNSTNTFNGASLITGQTNLTLTPNIDSVGNTYYFVVVGDSVNTQKTCIYQKFRNYLIGSINVLKSPILNAQPNTHDTNYCIANTLMNLQVSTNLNEGTYNIQWYKNMNRINTNGFIFNGVGNNTPTITPTNDTVGMRYYYAVLTQNSTNCSITSNISGGIGIYQKMGIKTQPISANYCSNTSIYNALTVLDTTAFGTVRRQWYKETNPNNFYNDTLLNGYTNTTYIITPRIATTNYYSVLLTYNISGLSSFCDSLRSNIVTVNVYDTPNIGYTIGTFGAKNYCINANATQLQTMV
ncbi:MAG: fibronectin type III domain-containing protein, partial [Sediminibacterium sp.]|nr:fibronectin type III domain-containing protein [Sediminibacterium sp.]